MATNRKFYEGRFVEIDVGASADSGDYVAVGNLGGVAMSDTDSDNKTVIDRGGIYDLKVYAFSDAASTGSAVAIGDVIYWDTDSTPDRLDKNTAGIIAGIALEEVSSGDNDTINVMLLPGNTTTVTAGSVDTSKMSPEYMKVATEALSSGAENAYAFAWQNPEDAAIIVHRVLVDVTAAGETSSTLDVGTAADATTNGDNLIDGVDITSTGVFDNIDDQGTNGESKQKMDEKDGTTDYITGQILAGAGTSLAGYVYIYYTEVQA